MITSNELRNGMNIIYDGNLYQVVDFMHVKEANCAAFVRAKCRNLRTGATTSFSINAGTKIEQANVEKKQMQFVYATYDAFVIMDNDTYEQIEIPMDKMQWEKNFLVEGMGVDVTQYEGEILGIALPDKVTLEVTEATPAVAGNTATSALKEVTLQTGFVVKVPMFINQGDKVVISTADGKYYSRA
jgi:elongation factor P